MEVRYLTKDVAQHVLTKNIFLGLANVHAEKICKTPNKNCKCPIIRKLKTHC
jgi:hypothetical protein